MTQAMAPAGGKESYTFASEPRPVGKRAKYREAPAADAPANIMFDKRVVRGNTYAIQMVPATPGDMSSTAGPGGMTKSGKGHLDGGASSTMAGDAPPVPGRRHIDAQTDSYLEELVDAVPEAEISTQTDAFMDRPPTPLFVPMKIGMDVETQIEAGDLFDFDFEVEPILEVLIGKTLEQGIMEVMEEEELAAMRAHQEYFEQIRNAELVKTQRMEAAEKRKVEEKERRVLQERARLDAEKLMREKVAAQACARGYVSGLMDTVFDRLYEAGFFYDPVEKEVTEDFLPWLKAEAGKRAEADAQARALVEALVGDALKANIQAHEAAEQARLDAKLAEEARLLAIEQAAARAAAIERLKERATTVLSGLAEPLLDPEMLILVRDEMKAAQMPPAPPELEEGAEPPPEPTEPAEPFVPVEPTDVEVFVELFARELLTVEAVEAALYALDNPPPPEEPVEGEAPAEAPAE